MNDTNTMDGITLYDSTLGKNDPSYKTNNQNTEEVCGQTETLTILNEFQRLYEARIEKAERELEGEYERLSAKQQIMEEWIRDLGEQNIMLVHTVEDLEHTASCRVKLLEEKLQQSSLVVTDSITRSGSTEEAISSLSNHVSVVETEQEQLQQKVSILKNDIKGLLKLIGRVWRDNDWYMDDIRFIEIHPDEVIPAPLNCPCEKEETNDRNIQSLKLNIGQLEDHKNEMNESEAKLEKSISHLSEEFVTKEELTKTLSSNDENFYHGNRRHTNSGHYQADADCQQYVTNVLDFQDILNQKDSMVNDLRKQLQKTKNIVSMINHKRDLELSNLNSQLDKKCKDCAKLTQMVCDIQKECQEYQQMQQISEIEILKRNNIILQLKKEVAKLKDSCSDAKLKIDLQNDVIKEMRTIIQELRCEDKVSSNENKVRLLAEEEGLQISNLKIEVDKLLKNNNEYTTVSAFTANAKMENVMPVADRLIQSYSKQDDSIMQSNENHGVTKYQLYNDIQFTRDIANAHQLLQTIETTINSAQNGLGEITEKLMEKETMQKMISSSCDTMLFTSLIQKINKFKNELSNCPQDIESLKHTFYSKDKLLRNLDEITKVQKDSITRMQAEIKDLQDKLQEKMKINDQMGEQYEKEKIELVKQVELQTQTIGHLQNAVVEAKRNLDHLGRKAATDLQERDQSIRISVMCAEEIERQYSECFTEAAEQNYLLDLQRDAINDLQDQLRDMEDEKIVITTSLHNAYYSIVDKLKGELDRRAAEFRDFKYKISLLVQSNTCLENEEFVSRLNNLIQDKESMKKELEKWKSSLYVLTEVLNIEQDDSSVHNILPELQRIKKTDRMLRYENQRLKEDLEAQIEEIKCLQNSLSVVDNNKEFAPEVSETISSLRGRVKSLTQLLTEKSNEMAKLQADYQVIKNDNSILKEEIRIQLGLKSQLNETLLNLKNDYQRLQEELRNKDQRLTSAAKTEVQLQASLTETIRYEREKATAIEQSNSSLKQKLKTAVEQNYNFMEEKMSLEQNNCKIVTELEEMHNSLCELKKKCLLKDEFLTSISSALTETATSRTELCKESQYVVHWIRIWMEENTNRTDKLTQNLKTKQEQVFQLQFEKKRLLGNVRTLEDTNNILRKRLRKALRCNRVAKFTYANDSGDAKLSSVHMFTPSCCNYARCMKVINISNNSGNKPRRNTPYDNEIVYKNDEDSDAVLEESRDYGYQSCTSK